MSAHLGTAVLASIVMLVAVLVVTLVVPLILIVIVRGIGQRQRPGGQ